LACGTTPSTSSICATITAEGVRARRVVAGLIAASVVVGVAIALLYALRIVFVA
jgi:hypothetical protein